MQLLTFRIPRQRRTHTAAASGGALYRLLSVISLVSDAWLTYTGTANCVMSRGTEGAHLGIRPACLCTESMSITVVNIWLPAVTVTYTSLDLFRGCLSSTDDTSHHDSSL